MISARVNGGAGCACGSRGAFAGGGTALLLLLGLGAFVGGARFIFLLEDVVSDVLRFLLFVFVVGCMDDDDPGDSARELLVALPVVSEDFGLKMILCSGTEEVESSSVKCTSMFHFLSEGLAQATTVASKMPIPGHLTWISCPFFRAFSLFKDMLVRSPFFF